MFLHISVIPCSIFVLDKISIGVGSDTFSEGCWNFSAISFVVIPCCVRYKSRREVPASDVYSTLIGLKLLSIGKAGKTQISRRRIIHDMTYYGELESVYALSSMKAR